MAPPQAERWQFLDAIRGVAAIFVVLQHVLWYASPSLENIFATIWSPGRFGVVAFFIVSGFIVPHSLEVKKDTKAFWRARFFRLYPAYWASLLIIALVQIVGLAWHPPFTSKIGIQWLVNLTMLQELVRIPDVNPVAWTLGLEIVLYLFITVMFSWGALKRTWGISVTLLGLLAFASVAMPKLLHMRFPAGAAAVGGSIVLGIILYRWFVNELSKIDAILLGVLCLLVTVLSSMVNYNSVRSLTDELQPTQLCAILSVITGYLFFLGMLTLRDRKFPQWLLWLGKVSYSLYLFHPIMRMIVSHEMNPWLGAGIEIILSLVAAWAGYEFIEKPFMKIARGKKAQVPATAP